MLTPSGSEHELKRFHVEVQQTGLRSVASLEICLVELIHFQWSWPVGLRDMHVNYFFSMSSKVTETVRRFMKELANTGANMLKRDSAWIPAMKLPMQQNFHAIGYK